MKKYPVSKFFIGSNIFGLFLMLGCEAFIIWLPGDTHCIEFYIVHAVDISSIIYILYTILTDLPTAKFSFSEEGITMYVGFKKYETPWSEFSYAGIIAINVEAVKSIYTSDLFWVYFSKSFLTDKEKIRFLSKTRRDLDRIAYFQFSKPVFDMVLEQIPENLKAQLKEDEEFVVGNMNFWERVYNK